MFNLPSQKRLTVLVSIILALMLIAGYVFIVYPSLDRINTLKSQIQVERTFLKVAGEKVSNDNNPQQEITSNHTAPPTKETDQVVLDLRQAETASQSEIQEITMGNGEKQSNQEATEQPEVQLSELQLLRFSVLLTSPDIKSIQKFIDTFEQSDRFYKVDSLEITSGESGTNLLTYQLEITTVFQQ